VPHFNEVPSTDRSANILASGHEPTHGISDSPLSVLAVRSAGIVADLEGQHT
jgi:lysine/ornithine N-monooxygenase